ncbi:hypothetical protein [Xenorhabdus bovienii]|nr:hypothetical protein [Xenorhabdus bovienii]MDE9431351.1 hypothetical protein [Xenorhabdus bovienii]MDE9442674.1 hypothetical protein [Xenorhabdus bovienii]MDE9466375.1 hypothetical protein [Xenorhabdus bovienii]MDE9488078.1 hypothetical protein [Xenorhabdus bovienii]MDE9489211.1 hypothetical protein [Xenorhabdus bovienii]
MKKIAILMLFALFLSGCAKTILIHDSKSPSDLEKDKYECMNIATQQAANWGAAGNPFIIKNEMMRCLQVKYGWREQ